MMHVRKRSVLTLTLMLGVGLCLPGFAQEPVAKLTVTTTETFAMGVFRVEGPMDKHRCSRKAGKSMGDGLNNTLAWGGGKSTPTQTYSVPAAGERFRFVIPVAMSSGPNKGFLYNCVVHADFVPAPGAAYLAKPLISSRGCSVSLVKVQSDGTNSEESSFRIRPQCFLQRFMSRVFEPSAKELYAKDPDAYF